MFSPVIGITAEWNPFHLGHAAMILALRRQFPGAALVGAMSGAFVQRGEPALFDKWTRARWAVESGMDAVFELPLLWALQSADRFAWAGVVLLAGLSVTHIAFGTESLTAKELIGMADWTLSEGYRGKLKESLASGASYAEASRTAMEAYSPYMAGELTRPNNLLGLKYVETIRSHHFPITPIAIHRDMEHNISASAVRKELLETGKSALLPKAAAKEAAACMTAGNYTDDSRYEDACLLASRRYTVEELSTSRLFTEGLEHKWEKESQRASYPAMLAAIKSKRYLYSRLKRTGAALLLSSALPSTFAAPPAPCYARLLALRREKSAVLRGISLPIITSTARGLKSLTGEARAMLTMDIRGTDVAAWCRADASFRGGKEDFYHSPEIV